MKPYETNRKSLSGGATQGLVGSTYNARFVDDRLSGDERVPFSDNERWLKFASNTATHCAIAHDGSLWCWGAPPVGDGTIHFRPEPVLISNEVWIDVTVGTAGGSFPVFGESPEDVAESWGGNRNAFLPSLGSTYVLAVKSDGTVWGWGANRTACMGNGMASTPAVVFARMLISSSIDGLLLNREGSLFSGQPEVDRLLYGAFPAHVDSLDASDAPNVVVVKHSDEDPGAGADIKLISRREITFTSTDSPGGSISGRGSGYTSPPQVEFYVIPVGGGDEIPLHEDSSHASLSAVMEYSVVGVQILSSTPFRGPVAVVFSEGLDFQTATGTCVVDSDGFVQSVTITSGGKYREPPTVTFYGTAGTARATPILSGQVLGYSITNPGRYVEKRRQIKARLINPPGHQGATAGLFIFYRDRFIGVDILDGGSGYTAPSGRPLRAAIDCTAFSQQPGASSRNEDIGEGRRGLFIGELHLSPSSVTSLAVANANREPDGRIRIADSLIPQSRPASISPFTRTVQNLPEADPPSAEIIWPGTSRQSVPLGVSFDADFVARQWIVSLGSTISDTHSETRPLLKITYPPSALPWSPANTTPTTSVIFQPTPGSSLGEDTWGDRRNFAGNIWPGFGWAPGVQYRRVNEDLYSGSASIEGRFALGDFLVDSGENEWDGVKAKFVLNSGDGLTYSAYETTTFPMYQSREVTPLRCSYEWLGPDVARGFSLDPFRVYYAGGETRGIAAAVSVSVDDQTSESNRLLSISLTNPGSGYTSEPIAVFTTCSLSPLRVAGSFSDCSAIEASAGAAYAISGGSLYSWAFPSSVGTLTPAKAGYAMTLNCTGAPFLVHGDFLYGMGWVESFVSPLLTPQCRGYTAASQRPPHGAEYVPFQRDFDAESFNPFLYDFYWLDSLFSIPDAGWFGRIDGILVGKTLVKDDIVQEALAAGDSVTGSTYWKYYLDPPSGPQIDGLSVSTSVPRPAEPLKDVYLLNSNTSKSIVVRDANDDIWVVP